MHRQMQYIRAAYKAGITNILRILLRVIKNKEFLDIATVNILIEKMQNEIPKRHEVLIKEQFGKIVRQESNTSLFLLKETLDEVSNNTVRRLNDYRFLIHQSEAGALSIGRRGQDIIRELSLRELESAMLKDSPTAIPERTIIRRILDRRIAGVKTREDAYKALQDLRGEVSDKVPVFHESGRTKFLLHIRPYTGEYRAYDVEQYADLVALTTVQESRIKANVARADEVGTRLLKWNDTGKSKERYLAEKDDRCAAINGAIVSRVPGGTKIGSRYFPYYKDLLPGPYDTPHPLCRHMMRPYIEELVVSSGVAESPTGEAPSPTIPTQDIEDKVIGVKDKKLVRETQKFIDSFHHDYPRFERLPYIITSSSQHHDTLAVFNPENVRITLNLYHPYWSTPKAVAKRLYEKKVISTPNPYHALLHEYGHYHHYKAKGKEEIYRTKELRLSAMELEIARQLSSAAKKSVGEFIAEALAYYYHYGKLPEEIEKVLSFYGVTL